MSKPLTRHGFLRLEWTPCTEPPTTNRRVLVWHRARKWCRFFRPVIGWWNGREWRRDGEDNMRSVPIYQPRLWRDFTRPKNKS